MRKTLPLVVTMGDPAGVGPLITWRVWASGPPDRRPFYLIAPPEVIERAQARVGVSAKLAIINDPSEAQEAFGVGLPVLPIPGPAPAPGEPALDSAPSILASIRVAVDHVNAGQAAAIVTNPIAKALLYAAGFPHAGHTEFLAELAAVDGRAPHPVMMLVGGGLRVALATIHTPLSSVPQSLSAELIVLTGRIVHSALQRDFKIHAPRLGICGLNPHAGEGGAMGREEIDLINPAAALLRADGIDASDARPGDTIFHEALGGRFDAVIAMYHDQGLIPVKTLDMWGGVNATLGLPFLRTSPDHGTAYDAAKSGTANPESLRAALRLADQMASARMGTT